MQATVRITKALRKSEGMKNMDEAIKKGQKEKWQKKLARIDQRRHDLLPKHAKMLKLSPSLAKFGRQVVSCDGNVRVSLPKNVQARLAVEKLQEDMDDNGQETKGSRRRVRQGAASHGRISGRRASEIGGSPLRFYGPRDRNHGSLALASVFDPAQFPNIAAGDSPR